MEESGLVLFLMVGFVGFVFTSSAKHKVFDMIRQKIELRVYRLEVTVGIKCVFNM